MANFKWARHRDVTRGHISLALEQIGETLLARRYHLQLDQGDVAEKANAIESTAALSQTDISNIESGTLPAHMRGDHNKVRAVLRALDFPEPDLQIYLDLFITLDVRLREIT